MLTSGEVKVRGMRRAIAVTACAVMGLGTCASALALRMTVQGAMPVEAARETGAHAHVPSDVMVGQVLTKVMPKYPQEAKDAKVQGAVLMHAVIDEAGVVSELTVISGPEPLRQSSLDAVKQWTYKPYVLDGRAVTVETTVTVNYSMEP